MENIIVFPTGGRLSSKMRRHLERGNLMTRRRLEENIRQSEIKALENIIDQAFGLETEPRKVLTIQRKPQNDSANAIVNLIVLVKENDEQQDPTPSFDNCCMNKAALYSTKTKTRRRLESGGVTARV
ncbi:hypothetical protein [Xenorhabdus bovienii]|uniref:Uncharacterized protein n=1 Tax=Xenorhabdus bovienii str. puntauvense TaxID=1398201 RepID=A0A077NAU2_XENBV|nr:hypothetical protein [Xenorhabdus bovienii]CDG95367.1 conserved hypothetical protein [Xenorhabdus bovienii str. puntauvense]